MYQQQGVTSSSAGGGVAVSGAGITPGAGSGGLLPSSGAVTSTVNSSEHYQYLQQQQRATSGVTASSLPASLPSSQLCFSSGKGSSLVSMSTQTELTMTKLSSKDELHHSELEQRDLKIEEQSRSLEEMRRQMKVCRDDNDKLNDRLTKCTDQTKQLLIEKSLMEKKAARQKSMQNRLRLGQFVTQRQGLCSNTLEEQSVSELCFALLGAVFAENWVDGSAFNELMKKQEQIAAAREEIERQRKMLTKKRPSLAPGKSKSTSNGGESSNGEFVKPESPKEMNWYEYYEQDEILKLRQQSLKKEDADLQLELEKLERERNLHIRELKRIHNEDQSRFNNYATLTDRYLLLMLLGKGMFIFGFACLLTLSLTFLHFTQAVSRKCTRRSI